MHADPYRVWLSEIMLQQTTTVTVIPYFARFLARFPTLGDLAAAPEEAVMREWAGLGYYARARNLHRCARLMAVNGVPDTVSGLRALPGIGPYTATAIAAIAFGRPGIPIDGNVERVLVRLGAIETPVAQAKAAIKAAAAALCCEPAAQGRPSDTAQALFDLGALLCTPGTPTCLACPWCEDCAARVRGIAASLPRKPVKPPRPIRHGAAFYLTDTAGRVLFVRRPAHGLLGGMDLLPGTEWRPEPWPESEAHAAAPVAARWRAAGRVRHVFTHFELRLDVYAARAGRIRLVGAALPEAAALPSVMRKCLALGAASLRSA